MDTRTGLKTGSEYTLDFSGTEGKRTFEITGEAGRGGSCIVYNVRYKADDRGNYIKGILKEYYPHDVIGLKRDDDGRILVPEAIKDKFEIKKEGFFRGFKLQTELRNMEGVLSNSIISAIDRFRGNGTEYLLMTKDNGCDFGNAEGLSLYENIKVIYDFSKILKLVHEEGYLMLDIKPENIFVTLNKEVGLFDFDSLKKLDEIKSGFISGSVDWSAPEVINYSDAAAEDDLLSAEKFLRTISERSDYYSIGKILKSVVPEDKHDEAYKNTSYEIFGKLEDFFKNTICNLPEDRYDNDDELISALEEITRLADPKELFINYYRPSKDKNAGYRDKELNELHNILSNNSSAFITAIGGMGKSELAKMYADKFKDEYDIIQFVNYADSMEDTVRRISVNGIDAEQAKDREWLYKKISDILDSQKGNVLIVIDNFDSEAKDIELLADRKNIKVIFTSRLDIKKLYGRYSSQTIELQPLSDEDSERLFCKLYTDYKDEELPVIRDIINTVNKNTLVIRLIALEMEDQGTEGKEILERLKNANVKDLEGEIFHNEEYRELYGHLLTVFNISQFDDDMKLILLKMSLVPYIYREDIKEWLDEENFNRINRLKNRGWIEYDNEAKQYSLHPVISMIAYEEMYEDRWQECEKILGQILEFSAKFELSADFNEKQKIKDVTEYTLNKINAESKCSPWFYLCYGNILRLINSYEKALINVDKGLNIAIKRYGDRSKALVAFCTLRGGILQKLKCYDEAIKCYFKAWDLCENKLDLGIEVLNSFGTLLIDVKSYKMALEIYKELIEYCENRKNESLNNFPLAEMYNDIGSIYSNISYAEKNDDEALKYYNKALEICEKEQNERAPLIGSIYNNIAAAYINKNEYDSAIIYSKLAIENNITIYGEDSNETMQSLNNLAVLYNETENYDEAINTEKKVLSGYVKIFGENSSESATAYHNLGNNFFKKGEYNDAELYYNKALQINKVVFGEKSDEYVQCCEALGEVYRSDGNYIKAIDYYSIAAEIYIKLNKAQSENAAKNYNNMGIAYNKINKYDEGTECFKKALDIKMNILGEKSKDILSAYINMATSYSHIKKYDKAEEYYKKVIDICCKYYGEDISVSHDLSRAYEYLGILYSERNLNPYKAIELIEKALVIRKKAENTPTLKMAELYFNLGVACFKADEYEKGISCYKNSLNIRENLLGENNILTAQTIYYIGNAYSKLKSYDEAIYYYKRALDIYNSMPYKDDLKICYIYFNLGNIYCKKDDFDKALENFLKYLELIKKYIKNNNINSNSDNIIKDISDVLRSVGGIYYSQSEYDKAIEKFSAYFDILINNSLELDMQAAISYKIMADIYDKKDDMEAAIDYYNKALDILMDLYKTNKTDKSEIAEVYIRMGNIYADFKQERMAITCYKKALELIDEGSNYEKTIIYANMGLCFKELEKYKQGIECCKTALKYIDSAKMPITEAEMYCNLAYMYYSIKKYKMSVEFAKTGFVLNKNIYGEEGEEAGMMLILIGDSYLKMKDISSAEYFYNYAIKCTERDYIKSKAYFNRAEMYFRKKEYMKAAENYKTALEYNKSGTYFSLCRSFEIIDKIDIAIKKANKK